MLATSIHYLIQTIHVEPIIKVNDLAHEVMRLKTPIIQFIVTGRQTITWPRIRLEIVRLRNYLLREIYFLGSIYLMSESRVYFPNPSTESPHPSISQILPFLSTTAIIQPEAPLLSQNRRTTGKQALAHTHPFIHQHSFPIHTGAPIPKKCRKNND
jgi:hypothetical protein